MTVHSRSNIPQLYSSRFTYIESHGLKKEEIFKKKTIEAQLSKIQNTYRYLAFSLLQSSEKLLRTSKSIHNNGDMVYKAKRM